MHILLAGMLLVPLLSLLTLIVMSGCTLLAIIWENEEKQKRKKKKRIER